MKRSHLMRLSEMREGDKGFIVQLEDGDLSLKLMEMGCLPGEVIRVNKIAPLGDPISVKIGSYLLSLRKEEAEVVYVRK